MRAIFARAGALSRTLQELDWEQTALGAPRDWPQSLCSAASICLGAKYPIAIYWGPDLNLIYNEAWSVIPGERHPWAMGRPGAEVWPDIWHIVGPEFDAAMDGRGTWVADRLLPMRRGGFLEETYFDYNLSPIHAEDGEICGVFNAGIETTSSVITERRQAVLLDVIEASATATSSDAVFHATMVAIDRHAETVPFALAYRLENGEASLAGATAAARAAPDRVDTVVFGSGSPDPFGLARLGHAKTSVVVTDVPSGLAAAVASAWPEPVHTAVVVPVRDARRHRNLGALVIGVPAGLPLGQELLSFARTLGLRVAASVADALRTESEREVFETEHRVATTLQRSLIPALPAIEGITVTGLYLAGSVEVEVGGDWYDAIPGPDGSVTFVIGDVVGKGVTAAAKMGQLRTAVRAYVLEGFEPGEVLARVNHLTLTLEGGTYATVLCLRFQPGTRRLEWCRGGHLPAIACGADGTVSELVGPGSPPVGVFPDARFVTTTTTLDPAVSLVLFTDGLVERRDRDIDAGIAELRSRLADRDASQSLLDVALAPVLDAERTDDVAVLVLET